MQSPTTASRPTPAAIAALLALTAGVFGPAARGAFVWDDRILLVDNRNIRAPDGLWPLLTSGFADTSGGDVTHAARYWRPLVSLAWAIEWRLFGDAPLGWHLINLALHLACVALVAAWLGRRVVGSSSPESARLGAILGAALFALHPSRPESVTWVSGATDLWAALFALLALRAWQGATTRGDVIAGATLGLAVASKESAFALPLAVAADHALREGAVPWRRLATLSVPAIALLAARTALLPWPDVAGPHGALDLPLRVLSSLGHAARMLVAPYPPAFFMAAAEFDDRGMPMYAPWSIALGAAVLAAIIAALARARRDPRWRPWMADLAWWVVLLAPALNVVPLRMRYLFSLRYLYLPMIGASALVARATASTSEGARRRATLAMSGALLVAAVVCVDRAGDLVSDTAVWSRERELRPELCTMHAELASARARARDYDAALAIEVEHYRCRTRGHSAVETARAAHAVAERLAQVTPDADRSTLRATAAFLSGFDPASASEQVALNARGITVSGRFDVATRRAVWPEVRPFLAVLEARMGEFDAAEANLRAALEADPRDATAWRNLAGVLALTHRWSEVVAACDRGLALLPSDSAMSSLRATAARALRAAPGMNPTMGGVTR